MLDQIQPYLNNRLELRDGAHKWLAGIIGDRPSAYAKSPSLWNAVFRTLGLDGIFLPFDVDTSRLCPLLEVIRRSGHVIGFSVTVPYKVEIIKFLDDLDWKARQIGAVNTVARTQDGKLVGYNTDGQGFLDMLTRPLPGQHRPFFENLQGRRVLLIGAGGAARAVAFFLAEALGDKGSLTIANRDSEKAQALVGAVKDAYPINVDFLAETDIEHIVSTLDLVINATTKGQSGVRRLAANRATCLEPYSTLAPAKPAELDEESLAVEPEFYRSWYKQSYLDIESNLRKADEVLRATSPDAAFVDLVYSPLETRTLAMARWSGHRILNGKEMNVRQAADAFVNRVMNHHLSAMGWDLSRTYVRVSEIMSQVW
jgi:shikimate dehydrogenase